MGSFLYYKQYAYFMDSYKFLYKTSRIKLIACLPFSLVNRVFISLKL